MVSTAEATTKAFQEFGDKHLKNEYRDVVPLLYHTAARFKIHMVKSRLKRSRTLRAVKYVRPTGVGNLRLFWCNAGLYASAKGPQALSKGVVEGAVLPWEIVIPFKISKLRQIIRWWRTTWSHCRHVFPG